MTNQLAQNHAPEAWRVVHTTLTVIAVASASWAVYALRGAWFLLFAAIVIGAALRPLVQQLERLRLPRLASGLTIFLVFACAIGALVILLSKYGSGPFDVLMGRIPGDVAALRHWMSHSDRPILARLGDRFSGAAPSHPLAPQVDQVSSAISFFLSIGHGAVSALLVLVIGFFWMLHGDLAVHSLLRFVPPPYRRRIELLFMSAELRVGGYVRGQIIVCLISCAIVSAAYLVIGLPYAIGLGVLAGVLEVVPIFGVIIAAVLASLVALALTPDRAIWVVALLFANHFLMSYVVGPRIIGRSAGINPFLVLLSISTFGALLGVLGAILAIPIAAVLQLFVDAARAPAPQSDTFGDSIGRDHHGVLRLRAHDLVFDVRKRLGGTAEAAEDPNGAEVENVIESLALDLERFLDDSGARDVASNSLVIA